MSQTKKRITNERRAGGSRLGTGAGIGRSTTPPRRGGGVPTWAWATVAVVLAAALVIGGSIWWQGRGGDGQDASVVQDRLSTDTLSLAEPTWPPNYDNLQDAIDALGLPGLSEEVLHWHVHVTIYADGQEVVIPSDVAFDAADRVFSPVHTHDEHGVVHVEADDASFEPTLLDFFDMWGVKFTDEQLGGYTGGVTVYKNGEEVPFEGGIPVANHDAITVVAGDPPADFQPDKSFKFAPGE